MGDGCFIGQGLTVDRRRSGELQVCGRRWRSSRGCVVWSMKPVLERLAGLEDLSEDDVSSAMGEVLDGDASPEELAVFLALLRAKKETATEVAAIANAMKSRMLPVETRKDVLEIVGTGGDGADTVNISTMAAVLSAACGATVAKHGNRSISSKSGSADVLEAIGIPLDLSPEGVAQCIDKVGIGFMFAPTHHPAMKTVQPVRRSMKIRSVFNIMGPLLNPAGAQRGIIGVYSPSVMNLMADTLVELGCKHALVVHTEGIDELSTVGVAKAIEIKGESVAETFIDPLDFGMPRCNLEDLRGGDAEYNAVVMRELLSGQSSSAIQDVVALNSGAGLYVYGMCNSVAEGVEMAKSKLLSGSAIEKLDEW
eukprot:CAMPEP_0113960138 /NCGR_PEP_ID=MMETSP0011_2-20120614/4542_1 /TAXON_ID=101924 /ORGANISM="Rhodosorus marinus" /LENGTH=366 /DNA_ID=CAMNT_0000971545 /DNA_START=326 /DNA_END=1423 /DNA_ORIENTATION=+ /assembly_acc=CAM_ASM_000156